MHNYCVKFDDFLTHAYTYVTCNPSSSLNQSGKRSQGYMQGDDCKD